MHRLISTGLVAAAVACSLTACRKETAPELQTTSGVQTLHDTIGQQGWVPFRVEGYELSGQSFYTSLWYYQPGTGYYIHSHLTREQLLNRRSQFFRDKWACL